MKKTLFIACLLGCILQFTACVALPDGNGGTYFYDGGGTENGGTITYERPDGSRIEVYPDGTIK